MLLGIRSPLGLAAFFTFQLHVYNSLHSQTLAFSQVSSGIALIKKKKKSRKEYTTQLTLRHTSSQTTAVVYINIWVFWPKISSQN